MPHVTVSPVFTASRTDLGRVDVLTRVSGSNFAR
jgi:hypothetical protein